MACNMTPKSVMLINNFVPGEDGVLRGDDPLGLKGGSLRRRLDDFNYPGNVMPTVYLGRQLWQHNTAEVASVYIGDNGIPAYGGGSLEIANAEPVVQVRYYNNRSQTGINQYWYVREVLGLPINAFNRIRVWIWVPPGSTITEDKMTNFHFGTYLRREDVARSEQESNNGHFYHYYNVEYVNNWEQLIIDPHVSTQRGLSGPSESRTILEFPEGSGSGIGYFSAMTYFYTQFNRLGLGNGNARLGMVELFHEDDTDMDLHHVNSLQGVLNKVIPNQIRVGWKQHRYETTRPVFDIKYAWSSFKRNGGFNNHGAFVPNGQNILGQAVGDYWGNAYRTTDIDLTGRSGIYIAIKCQLEATKYREIYIPLIDEAYPLVEVA